MNTLGITKAELNEIAALLKSKIVAAQRQHGHSEILSTSLANLHIAMDSYQRGDMSETQYVGIINTIRVNVDKELETVKRNRLFLWGGIGVSAFLLLGGLKLFK